MTLSPSAEMVFLAASGAADRRPEDAGRASMRATDARITRMSALKRSSVRTSA